MSRTIRRKTCLKSPFELEWKHFNSYSTHFFLSKLPHLSLEEILIFKNKIFHSDNFSKQWSFVGTYKRKKSRTFKRQNRFLFNQAWKKDEDFVEIPFKQTFRRRC